MTVTIRRLTLVSSSVPTVYRISAAGGSVPNIYTLSAASTGGTSRPRVYAVSASASLSSPSIYRLTAVSTGAAVTPVVDPIPPRTVFGWDQVTITPTAVPTPDSWIYTVLAGNVTLTGSGTSRTFEAPAVFAGTTVQIAVQASKGGVLSPQRVAVFTVIPWNSFVLSGSPAVVDTIDGGTAGATVPDVIDGGTTSSSANTVDGGTTSSTGLAWVPRRPFQAL